MSDVPHPPFEVRSFRLADGPSCQSLYLEGLIGGKLADNDTGFDIDAIDKTYMLPDGGHFWVAEDGNALVSGMIGVQSYDGQSAEIRRLRVRPDRRNQGVGVRLLETALAFCQDKGYVKVTLDTFVNREISMALFGRYHLRHESSRLSHGKEVSDFFLDLYSADDKPQ